MPGQPPTDGTQRPRNGRHLCLQKPQTSQPLALPQVSPNGAALSLTARQAGGRDAITPPPHHPLLLGTDPELQPAGGAGAGTRCGVRGAPRANTE